MSARGSTALLCALLLGFFGLWQLQHAIDAQLAATHQEEDNLVLRSGPLLRAMSLDYAPLTADLYWTRAVQYYGNKHAADQTDIELLLTLLDGTTTVDPNLIVVYRFGAIFFLEAPPQGVGEL